MAVEQALAQIEADAVLYHSFVHGTAGSVLTDHGSIVNMAMQAYRSDQKVLQLSIFNPRGAWVTGAVYAFRDIVTESSVNYMVLTGHTAGTFATDLAAGRLAIHQDPTAAILQAALAHDLEGEGVDFVARAKKNVATVDDLDSTPPGTHENVYVRCFETIGDGGFGEFEWIATSEATPIRGMVHQVVGIATGRWIRQHDGVMSAKWLGEATLTELLTLVSSEIDLVEGAYSTSSPAINDPTRRIVSSGESFINGIPVNHVKDIGRIEKPDGFTWDAPLHIFKHNDTFKTTLDPRSFEKASRGADKITYYVNARTGVNSRDGLTPETAKRSLGLGAIAAGNTAGVGNIVVYVAAGVYSREDSWVGVAFNGNITVICEDGVYLTSAETYSSLTWTNLGGGVFSAPRTVVSVHHGVVDLNHQGSDGKPFAATPKTSLAGVEAESGSYYTDGTTVYVHLLDGRQPDINTLVLLGVSGGAGAAGAYTSYVKNANFYGGDVGAFRTGTGAGSVAVFVDCDFAMASFGSGLASQNTELTIAYGCDAHKNWVDGFNYHDYASVGSKVIEVDCKAWWNGYRKLVAGGQSQNSNASSAHEGTKVVRVNTVGYENYGPNIVDVNTVECWNVGCKAFDSLAETTSKVDFQFADTAVNAWMHGCEGGYTGYQILKNSGSNVYIRNWVGGYTVLGVVTPY